MSIPIDMRVRVGSGSTPVDSWSIPDQPPTATVSTVNAGSIPSQSASNPGRSGSIPVRSLVDPDWSRVDLNRPPTAGRHGSTPDGCESTRVGPDPSRIDHVSTADCGSTPGPPRISAESIRVDCLSPCSLTAVARGRAPGRSQRMGRLRIAGGIVAEELRSIKSVRRAMHAVIMACSRNRFHKLPK